MNQEALKSTIKEHWPEAAFEEGAEWTTLQVDPVQWRSVATLLRKDPNLHFDFLVCVTCVDWNTHLSMVYHLRSTKYRHEMVVKAALNQTQPEIHTVSDIWRTAEFHEREQYEMFGVNFLNHPDQRLLILPDGWEGKNPMRKNYEDPVNMIKL